MSTAVLHALSPDQQRAHDAVLAWWKAGKPQILTLGGYAGTGKSTTVARIAATIRLEKKPPRIAFCCFTGKAALVLRHKLWKAQTLADSYCGTIHALIYAAITDGKGRVTGWRRKGRDEVEADLFILDEASMVDEKLLEDLKSYGLPILAVGDHGQLPPVTGTLNLMENPEIRLETIHRQAAENPIIRVSMMAREGRRVPQGHAEGGGGSVTKMGWGKEPLEALDSALEALLICGTNKTRLGLNQKLRGRLGYKGAPASGEKLICLRNNRQKGIYNGMMGILESIAESGADHYQAKVRMEAGFTLDDRLSRHQFGQAKTISEWPGLMPFDIGERFDWGYAVTAHKAQGSEADTVVVYEECDWMENEEMRRRWRYTAFTRARKRLIIVGR